MSPLEVEAPPFNENVPVLIVGGVPQDSQTLIVDRYPTRLAAPKAHAISPRSLELWRQFGLDVNQIRALGTPRADAYWANFITSGDQAGRLPYERMDPGVLDATPTIIHNNSQPIFEELVARELAQLKLGNRSSPGIAQTASPAPDCFTDNLAPGLESCFNHSLEG
ncbi:hypothetical protein BDW75DRAFT_237819 [Aspergillus navahoensis]